MSMILTAIAFITIITILVAAHEFGHYIFARLFGMGVEEFAIGFGKKPLFTFLRKTYDTPEGPETTVFTVRPWPIGGFVRIKAMMPEDDGSEVKVVGGFYSKPHWQRLVTLLAGPVFSILAGFAILVPLYMTEGMPKPSNEPIIGQIQEGGPAHKAGLKVDDRIVSVNGQPISTFFEAIKIVRERPEQPTPVVVNRDGKEISATLVPLRDQAPTTVLSQDLMPTEQKKVQGKIAAVWKTVYVPLSFGAAMGEIGRAPIEMVKSLAGIAMGKRAASEELGGPITMIAATSETVKRGFGDVLSLAGLLSISLGIFNLLPVPPLDGGQMVVTIAEMLRGGKRLSMKVQERVATIGLALVGMLIVSIFFIDIKRFLVPPDKPRAATSQSK